MAATHEISILGANTAPDTTGKVFQQPLETAMSLGTATLGTLLGMTMQAPAGGGDCGFYGSFTIPQNYVGTPKIVVLGYVGENPATNSIAFAVQFQPALADNETLDQSFDTEDTSGAISSAYSVNDLLKATITLTPATAFAAGDVVNYYFKRDDTNDAQSGEFHVSDLLFQYADG